MLFSHFHGKLILFIWNIFVFYSGCNVSYPNSLIFILLTSCFTAYPRAMIIYTPSACIGCCRSNCACWQKMIQWYNSLLLVCAWTVAPTKIFVYLVKAKHSIESCMRTGNIVTMQKTEYMLLEVKAGFIHLAPSPLNPFLKIWYTGLHLTVA